MKESLSKKWSRVHWFLWLICNPKNKKLLTQNRKDTWWVVDKSSKTSSCRIYAWSLWFWYFPYYQFYIQSLILPSTLRFIPIPSTKLILTCSWKFSDEQCFSQALSLRNGNFIVVWFISFPCNQGFVVSSIE